MTKSEFEEINSWSDLKNFCSDNDVDACDYIIDADYAIDMVKNECDSMLRLMHFIGQIKRFDADWYKIDGYGNLKDVESSDLEDIKSDIESYFDFDEEPMEESTKKAHATAMKENYRGIKDIEFINRGTQSDPALKYKGKTLNYYDIEDSMWDYYNEMKDSDSGYEDEKKDYSFDGSDEDFNKFVVDHADSVYGDFMDLTGTIKCPSCGADIPDGPFMDEDEKAHAATKEEAEALSSRLNPVHEGDLICKDCVDDAKELIASDDYADDFDTGYSSHDDFRQAQRAELALRKDRLSTTSVM